MDRKRTEQIKLAEEVLQIVEWKSSKRYRFLKKYLPFIFDKKEKPIKLNNKQKKLVSAHKNLAIAKTCYAGGRGEYYLEDFLLPSNQWYIIEEVNTGESDFTPEGVEFLSKFWTKEEKISKLIEGNIYSPEDAEKYCDYFFSTMSDKYE